MADNEARRPISPDEVVELVARLGSSAEVAGFARQMGPAALARMLLAERDAEQAEGCDPLTRPLS